MEFIMSIFKNARECFCKEWMSMKTKLLKMKTWRKREKQTLPSNWNIAFRKNKLIIIKLSLLYRYIITSNILQRIVSLYSGSFMFCHLCFISERRHCIKEHFSENLCNKEEFSSKAASLCHRPNTPIILNGSINIWNTFKKKK